MRLPYILSLAIGLSGCTISPTTVHFADLTSTQTRTFYYEHTSGSGHIAPTATESLQTEDPEVIFEPLPRRPRIPPVPSFTDEELTDPDVIEEKLVNHIRELRHHIGQYYQTLDAFEQRYQTPSMP